MFSYKYNPDTYEYVGVVETELDPLETEQQGTEVWLLPADSTFTKPLEVKDGFAICWNGNAWEYKEDHRQKRDNGGAIIGGSGTAYWLPDDGDNWQSPARYMENLGPLPVGAVTVRPEQSEQEKQEQEREQRRQELKSELSALDLQAVRPLRAIAAGTATDEDHAKLAELEAQAEKLRAELSALGDN